MNECMCVCRYVCMYVRIHIDIHTYIHAHAGTYAHTCMLHTRIHAYMHTYIECAYMLVPIRILNVLVKKEHVYIYIYIYDAGLPPPHPMVSTHATTLACQVGSCLVWRCCFPRLVLFGLVPSPPCGVGPVVFLVGPALPVCSTEVWYGCCRLLVVMSSLCASSPPPPVWGSVFYRDMVWLLPLVSSNVVMLLFSPCKRCPCPCSDAVLRSCEEALAGMGSFRLSGTAGSRGRPGRGPGGGGYHGGGGVGARDPNIYIYMCLLIIGLVGRK